jgi:hypothetical protein
MKVAYDIRVRLGNRTVGFTFAEWLELQRLFVLRDSHYSATWPQTAQISTITLDPLFGAGDDVKREEWPVSGEQNAASEML